MGVGAGPGGRQENVSVNFRCCVVDLFRYERGFGEFLVLSPNGFIGFNAFESNRLTLSFNIVTIVSKIRQVDAEI